MVSFNHFWISSLALLLLASPLLQVGRCQTDSDEAVQATEEASDTDNVGDESFPPAPGIDTISVFPKNSARLVTAGEETELLVGVKNDGDSSLNVIAIKASVHLAYDHRLLVQNLTTQVFKNGKVPASAQATFPYLFAVSKFLQPGNFDLVGTIVYEIDQRPYQSTFYNGTIEVVEAGAFLSIESVFLVSLGASLLALLGIWINGKIESLSKKTKRAPKVEVGTRSTDASLDEWLQGTAYAQSQANKSKKKNAGMPSEIICKIAIYIRLMNQSFPMKILTQQVALVCFWLSLLFVLLDFCHAEHSTTVKVVGLGECTDCKEYNIKTSKAFSGLRVTVECKAANEPLKTRGDGELDKNGNFKVSLPNDIVKDGEMKEECYAQLHSASAAPCPAQHGLDQSKIVIHSKDGDKHTLTTAGKLKFASLTCTSAFFWHFFKHEHPFLHKLPHLPHFSFPTKVFPPKFFHNHPLLPPKVFPPFPPKFFPNHPLLPPVPVPIYEKPLPPPVPVYEKPLPPLLPVHVKPIPPVVPIYHKPLPPPLPTYHKPLSPPVPIYKKPLPPPVYHKSFPPPTPTYKKPLPPQVPIYHKPIPPPTYKKPLPPQVPVYHNPIPPPTPTYNKPLPPPVPVYHKPFPPPIIPTYKKPLPPPVPVYKKLLPPPVPIYTKPLPPPVPILKKPCPPKFNHPLLPPVPILKKPLPPSIPIHKPLPPPPKFEHPLLPPKFKHPLIPHVPIHKPPFIKPLPPFPKLPPFKKLPFPTVPKFPPKSFFHHPKFGKWLPLPPFSPHP
ncbi:unnamed protein product [Lupinus luteus]|uniref:Translocon-associated protein subunit alpha n=1 Tax=Lupinus luteus TaxID=3873 RepID=A0AAV1W4Q9_LUPLU